MSVELSFVAVLEQWPTLLKGLYWTVLLTVLSAIFGLVLALGFAWVRTSGPLAARVVVGAYVEFIRNTPFIVQLFFIFFGLPSMGFKLSPEGHRC